MEECIAYVQGATSATETAVTNTWWVGVLLAVGGSFMSVLGLNLQRYSQKKNDALPEELRKSAFRQPMNVGGIVLMALNAVLDLISFGFAPQSLIAPLGAVTLILNIVVAPYILKEKVTKRDLISTVLVFVGVVLCVVFSSRATPVYSYQALMCLFQTTQFVCYAILMAALLLASVVFLYRTDKSDEFTREYYRMPRQLLFPAVAGTMGGGSVLFGKASVEMIKYTALGNNSFIYFGTYVLIFSLVACLLLQVRFLNRGLQLFEALFVVPVYQVFWVLVGILGGSIYFDEFRSQTPVQWVFYLGGVGITFSGVLLLATRKPTLPPQQEIRHSGTEIAVTFDNAVQDLQDKTSWVVVRAASATTAMVMGGTPAGYSAQGDNVDGKDVVFTVGEVMTPTGEETGHEMMNLDPTNATPRSTAGEALTPATLVAPGTPSGKRAASSGVGKIATPDRSSFDRPDYKGSLLQTVDFDKAEEDAL